MISTQTGFPIGFRRGGSDWQNDLGALLAWAKSHEMSALDLGTEGPDAIAQVTQAGLRVGSVDALAWGGLLSPDAGKRAEAVAKNADYIQKCSEAGARNFFIVLLPEKPDLGYRENFKFAVESLQQLAPTLETNNARLVIEGWPGPGALGCTPETLRALFSAVPSTSIGLNYDPSHLLRMGIDPLRFLNEFASRVGHVHGKDTEILADKQYEFGHELPATFAEAPDFGASAWRYTIPGAGATDWPQVFRVLQNANYNGAVCIELEDANYNGTTDGEQHGLLAGAAFLAKC